MVETAAIESLSGDYRLASARMLEFRILGPLEVLDGDRPVRLGGPKQRAALAILLLNANRVVSVERLADDLYGGAPPVTAVTQVQRQVSDLRKLLGAAAIETRSPGYVLHVEPGRLDLDRFERWTSEAGQALERGDAQAASDLFGARSSSGAERRSQTSRTSRSRRRRSHGSTSCAWPRSSSASRRSSRSAGTAPSSPSSRRSCGTTRSASGCAAS